jgi:hypothetical protein
LLNSSTPFPILSCFLQLAWLPTTNNQRIRISKQIIALISTSS